MLVLPVLALYACSGQDDGVSTVLGAADMTEYTQVRMAVSQNSSSNRAADAESITVYVYKQEQKTSVLVDEQVIDATKTHFTYELPLGESYQTFAVSNVASVTGKETLETVTIHVDPSQTGEVWLSNLARFSSDKSVKDVSLVMRRLVAEVNFAPAETVEELSAYTQFDNLDVTFSNVATAYHVKDGTVDLEQLKLNTTLADGYQMRFFSFDTTAGDANASVFINYMKGNELVNMSSSQLDAGVKFAASHRYNLIVPVTNADFLAEGWETASAVPLRSCRVNQIMVTENIMK